MLFASGMCASTVMLLALVPAGGHIVTTTDCYRKTRIFIETVLPKMGITVYHQIFIMLSNVVFYSICDNTISVLRERGLD